MRLTCSIRSTKLPFAVDSCRPESSMMARAATAFSRASWPTSDTLSPSRDNCDAAPLIASIVRACCVTRSASSLMSA